MPKIAISYRRTDSDVTGRIFDRLVQRYGEHSIFRDIDSIPFGIDFRKAVSDALRDIDVLIAVVGPNWRGSRKLGRPTINQENDFVRIEIETALQRNIPVIPVLVSGAVMPKATELPKSLRDFSFRNAANIDSGRNFDTDVGRLVRSMDQLCESYSANVEAAVLDPTPQPKPVATNDTTEKPVETAATRPLAVAVVDQPRGLSAQHQAHTSASIREPPINIGPMLVVAAIGIGLFLTNYEFSLTPKDVADGVTLSPERERALTPKDRFKECATCPEMVLVPAGLFTMGSSPTESGRKTHEGPQHRVTFAKPFAVGRFSLTFDEWDACVADGSCGDYKPSDEHWGRGQRPVINVGWDDAKAYVTWLSQKTGKTYRLLSESEWEYAARAGSTAAYFWDDEIGKNNANCIDCGSQWDGRGTSPVGSFKPNAFGLYDMAGNVWQWVEDCYHANYNGAPDDGSAWISGVCSHRIFRGGAWDGSSESGYLRSASRFGYPSDYRIPALGFRVGRTLLPL